MTAPTVLKWQVMDRLKETPDVSTLILTPLTSMPSFIPGQYVSVMLPGHEPLEGKCYSITSLPQDPYLSITVKDVGVFSHALSSLGVDTTLYTSLPYGFFYPDEEDNLRELVFIAGGIGIAPCMSIIESLSARSHTVPYHLLYANRTNVDTVFRERLKAIKNTDPHFHCTYWISREPSQVLNGFSGRISADTLQNAVSGVTDPLYFICGSTPFTRSIFTLLRRLNVPHTSLYTEGFY